MTPSREQNPRHSRSRSYYQKKKKKKNVRLKSDSFTPEELTPDHQGTKKTLTEEEQKIRQLGVDSYDQALAHYFFPSLPHPKFVFDYERNTGFHINFQNYQITMNLANTPNIYLEQELIDYFHSLSIHEIGHYVYCPYDNSTNLKLLGAAIKAGVNKYYAPIILNIFADLLIDYRNHQDFPTLMEWELKTTVHHILSQNTEEMSILWKLLVRSYEIMWGEKILPDKFELGIIDQLAQKISDIILKDLENDALWEQKIIKIAKTLNNILKSECNINSEQYQQRFGEQSGSGFTSDTTQGMTPIEVPDDVKATFGDLTEIKYPDFVKNAENPRLKSTGPEGRGSLQQSFEDLAPEMNFDSFRDLLFINGFNDSNANLALWYRGKAKNLIEINIFRKKPGSSIPFTPSVWRLGEPIEKLDITQTLLTSPVIIPNITTRKWECKDGPGHLESDILPDLMLVVDSSGSMDWNIDTSRSRSKINGRYHTALMAAFAALHFGLSKGVYISGINFSDRVKSVKWSNKPTALENLLLHYQGHGTVLPMKRVKQLATENQHPCLILLISDLEINNWETVFPEFMSLLKMGHKILSFIIEGDREVLEHEDLQELAQTGAIFYILDDASDLVGLVIKEIQQIYR